MNFDDYVENHNDEEEVEEEEEEQPKQNIPSSRIKVDERNTSIPAFLDKLRRNR